MLCAKVSQANKGKIMTVTVQHKKNTIMEKVKIDLNLIIV